MEHLTHLKSDGGNGNGGLRVGDWVQALEQIDEADLFAEGETWVHAEPRAIGHVMQVEPDGWPLVTWERTGTTTLVDPTRVQFLCHWDAGR